MGCGQQYVRSVVRRAPSKYEPTYTSIEEVQTRVRGGELRMEVVLSGRSGVATDIS